MPAASPRRIAAAVAVLVLAGAGVAYAMSAPSPPSAPPASVGVQVNQPVPDLPLVSESGRPTSLAALRGKVVVLTPFLTSCQEVCPLTTGAYLELRRSVEAAGLGSRVAFVEVSTDPGRDTPARLRAYARYTGASWDLLTGSPAELARLWKFFGVAYYRVPEGHPAGINWQDGRPYTYDVDHTDAVFFLGPHGTERFAMVGTPSLAGPLPARLYGMLDPQGRQDLTHPQEFWTVAQAREALAWLLGHRLPA